MRRRVIGVPAPALPASDPGLQLPLVPLGAGQSPVTPVTIRAGIGLVLPLVPVFVPPPADDDIVTYQFIGISDGTTLVTGTLSFSRRAIVPSGPDDPDYGGYPLDYDGVLFGDLIALEWTYGGQVFIGSNDVSFPYSPFVLFLGNTPVWFESIISESSSFYNQTPINEEGIETIVIGEIFDLLGFNFSTNVIFFHY